ncbi:hypothetical protein [Kocuria aegyptia]|uniref:Uncharacterized protein n=1 Tax=Kocuria aegyptia TaxID=330943 RepID=A0ABN2K2K4_9MICC
MASSLVRVRPQLTVLVTGNDAARHQHACQLCLLRLIGRKPCTCPTTYRLMNQSCRVGDQARPFVQDITDPQCDCPRCGHYPAAM